MENNVYPILRNCIWGWKTKIYIERKSILSLLVKENVYPSLNRLLRSDMNKNNLQIGWRVRDLNKWLVVCDVTSGTICVNAVLITGSPSYFCSSYIKGWYSNFSLLHKLKTLKASSVISRVRIVIFYNVCSKFLPVVTSSSSHCFASIWSCVERSYLPPSCWKAEWFYGVSKFECGDLAKKISKPSGINVFQCCSWLSTMFRLNILCLFL